MKKSLTVFVRIVIVLISILILAIMIRFPLTEGRAKNLDLFSIYSDPFIVYGYLSSIAMFIALYKTFKLFEDIAKDRLYSQNTLKTLRVIKHCTIIITFLILLAATYIKLSHSREDDPTGFLVLCMIVAFFSITVAAMVTISERIIRNTIE